MCVLAPLAGAKATFTKLLALLVSVVPMRPLRADPCGMVPPINALAGAIQRTGVQVTYVFFHDGIASIVLRPGFTGSVDEFGMLIPFPSPPSVRKVADNVFEQIAAAIDPPEVIVDRRPSGPASAAPAGGGASPGPGLGFRDVVHVIRQEAVGMYQVAVLEAGSAGALERWMNDHGYRYPDGMDRVCEDYVTLGWCFVAVKTRVGSKDAVAPRPGQRAVDARLPAAARFDGRVQAMGFRFRCNELEVPMRLSTFNGGDARNVVYLLTDKPCRIRNLPRTFVKRQVSGRQLWHNVTQPLNVRVLGGTVHELSARELEDLAPRRDPAPHNAVAKELFLADVEAARHQRLTQPREDAYKRLADISDGLGLRGAEIDALIERELASRVDAPKAARSLSRLTMTVIDGAFSRDVLARENLTFAPFRMRAERNLPERYDARRFGPSDRRGAVPLIADDYRTPPPTGPVLLLLGAVVLWLSRCAIRGRRSRTPPAAALRGATPTS